MKTLVLDERKREWLANRKLEWKKERWREARYAAAEAAEETFDKECEEKLREFGDDWLMSSDGMDWMEERQNELQDDYLEYESAEDEAAAWQKYLTDNDQELSKQFAEYDASEKVYVRRQMDDYRVASIPISRMTGLRYDTVSGGVQTDSSLLLYCSVWCTDLEGDIAHSCVHGKPPHEIKVCVLETDNEDLWNKIQQMVK